MCHRSSTRPSAHRHLNLRPSPVKTTILLSAISILLAGCGGEKPASTGSANRMVPGVSVVVAPVIRKTVPLFTELTARTDASDSVDIRARVKSFLLTQNYVEGTMVDAGQVLFTLDKREYEAQLMQAKAQLAKAQADLAQAQERTLVDTAQANVGIAVAQLNKTDQDVKRLKPLAEQRAVPQQDYDNARRTTSRKSRPRRQGRHRSTPPKSTRRPPSTRRGRLWKRRMPTSGRPN